ncbi:MAG TPA: class II aldolase/adducin family protein [Chthoniobacterales bacterium]|nr:class II aldolase/adducin family protein [Chthoniobacterales bacterium]
MNVERSNIVADLLTLSHEFGHRGLVILGEGNVSARLDDSTFLVKASGSSLAVLTEENLTQCRFDRLLPSLKSKAVSDAQVETALLESRVDPNALKPSVETFFHALLLTLPDVQFVGHAHPIPVNQILCSSHARAFSHRRQCPDEVVCCGPVSLLIPYVDPGLALAKKIRDELRVFQERTGKLPRVILLKNHGMITLGPNMQAVRAAMLMTVKAAEIFVGAQLVGGLVHLPDSEVSRIENRQDEEYRRKMLRI